jgi:hypothetical protein
VRRFDGSGGGVVRAIALDVGGWVYGILLVEDDVVTRAWLDQALDAGRLCQTYTYSGDQADVMEHIGELLAIRSIPEVNVADYNFNFLNLEG